MLLKYIDTTRYENNKRGYKMQLHIETLIQIIIILILSGFIIKKSKLLFYIFYVLRLGVGFDGLVVPIYENNLLLC